MVTDSGAMEPAGADRHRVEVVVDGDPIEAGERAARALAHRGFRIDHRSGSSIRLTGPGLRSTRQDPLLGASAVQISPGARHLSIEAELGGIRFLQRFLRWFPPTLLTVLSLPVLILFLVGVLPPAAMLGPAIAVAVNGAVWMVVGPWASRRMAERTRDAVDTLAHNAANGL